MRAVMSERRDNEMTASTRGTVSETAAEHVAAFKRERNTLRSMRLWREGRHWQAERGPLAVWVGIASDRLMVGLIWNHEARSLGVGLGPIYAGIGASYAPERSAK